MDYFISIAVMVLVMAGALLLLPRILNRGQGGHTRHALRKITEENDVHMGRTQLQDISVLRGNVLSESAALDKLLKRIPGMEKTHELLVKSGLKLNLLQYLGVMLACFVALLALFTYLSFGIGALFIAGGLTWFVPRKYLEGRIRKRNENFIDMFPDALDMIVRSVKSGHPLNAALRMIAENMNPPVSTEFKQVVDEISYGRTMTEALYRLAKRIDETDINFFVVVLVVQQETGGNLAEVLSNLSTIIRKRKQLRLKIKAITSEARITAWILGSLPFLLLAVLHVLTPGYLTPLFKTDVGRFILGLSLSMVGLCGYIVRRMIRIEI